MKWAVLVRARSGGAVHAPPHQVARERVGRRALRERAIEAAVAYSKAPKEDFVDQVMSLLDDTASMRLGGAPAAEEPSS